MADSAFQTRLRTFGRFYGKGYGAVLLLVFLLMVIGLGACQSPEESTPPVPPLPLSTWLDDGDAACRLPCVAGIIPGETTVDEALAILESAAWVEPGSFHRNPNRHYFDLYPDGYGELRHDGEIVSVLELYVHDAYQVQDGLAQIGPPQAVAAEHHLGHGGIYNVAFFYPERGVVLMGGANEWDDPLYIRSNAERVLVHPELRLTGFYFQAVPADLHPRELLPVVESFEGSWHVWGRSIFRPWDGYGFYEAVQR